MVRKSIFVIIISLCFLFPEDLHSQEVVSDHEIIQFSGVVIKADDLTSVPYTTVRIKNTRKGTISDPNGYFSIVVTKQDTLTFSAIGYKYSEFAVPDTITMKRY